MLSRPGLTRRRLALIAALAVTAAGAAAAAATAISTWLPAQAGDMSLGSPKAKVQLVEYASLSCPHCARFNAEVFPAFKAKYVDTGKVRYTLREMLTPPSEVAAAGFLMARCAGPGNYFKVVDAVFRSQARWEDGDIRGIFLGIAQAHGLTEARFEACLKDGDGLKAINGRVDSAVAAGVNSTPTFFVNGKKFEGEISLQQLDAAIAAARK
jgi:protein-disulfide isomerase